MASLNSGTISRRTVEGLPVEEREAVFWDRELSGFGVRVYPSGSKVYLVQTRDGWKVAASDHRTARDRVTPEQARRKAAMLIAGIKAGEEPSRNGDASAGGPTLAEVGERYLREHVAVRCKPTTAGAYRHALTKIPPSGVRVPASCGDRPRSGGVPPLPSPQDADDGEPSGGHPFADLRHGGGLGHGAGGREPVPVREEVPGKGVASGFCRTGSSADWGAC